MIQVLRLKLLLFWSWYNVHAGNIDSRYNLQWKLKKVQVIGSLIYRDLRTKLMTGKKVFTVYCYSYSVHLRNLIAEKSSENGSYYYF